MFRNVNREIKQAKQESFILSEIPFAISVSDCTIQKITNPLYSFLYLKN